MTALCGGGASQAKPGFAQTIVMNSNGFVNLLSNVPVKWAAPLAWVLAPISYDLSTLCATDPPAMPTITGLDMVNLALPLSDPLATAVSIGKLYDLVKIYAWYQFCQCASVSTPAPPAGPPPPSNAPQINPPNGVPVGSTSGCYSGNYAGAPFQYATAGGPPFPDQYNAGQLTPGWATGPNEITAGPSTNHTVILPSPAPIQVRLDSTIQFQAGATQPAYASFKAWTTAGGNLGQLGYQIFPAGGLSQNVSALVAVPPTAAYVQVAAVELDQPAPSQMQLTATWFCPGSPSGTVTTPCPPDPVVTGLLDQILAMVTLIQRQGVPFGTIHGNVHSGLTGSGTISVSGLIGCSLQVTAHPSYIGQTGTLPVELFGLGYITWSNPDGYPQSERIEHLSQLSLPARCGAFAALSYDLPAGVALTITELKREP